MQLYSYKKLKVVSCIYFLSNISMTFDVIFVSLTLVRLGFLKLVSSEEGVKLTPRAPPPPPIPSPHPRSFLFQEQANQYQYNFI